MLKNINFWSECLDCVNHWEKFIFFKNEISVFQAKL